MVIQAITSLKSGDESNSWPSVQGEIISSALETRENVAEKQKRYSTYHAAIRYRYQVSSKEYTSDRVVNDQQGKRYASDAEGWVKKYPQGKTVTVYYNPASPQQAVLETGRNSQTYGVLVFGTALLVIGSGLLARKLQF